MHLYAIAGIIGLDGAKAVRCIDAESLKVIHIEEREIPFRLRKFNESNQFKVMNLEVSDKHKEGYRWSQGVDSRYPFVNLEQLCGVETVVNRDSITVLTCCLFGGKKRYLVANYQGKTTNIDEDKLIQYGLKYSLTNCKVVTKGNTQYIAAIEGSIPEIEGKIETKILRDTNDLVVSIPALVSDTLDLQELLGSKLITSINGMILTPNGIGNGVKKLIVAESIDNITSGFLACLPNLEEIEFKAKTTRIWFDTFIKCRKLKKIKANIMTSDGYNNCEIRGLPLLETVETERILGAYSFPNCPNIDINQALANSTYGTLHKAFIGNKRTKVLIIPKHIERVCASAFENCSIERVEFNGRHLKMVGDSKDGRAFSYNRDVELVYFKGSTADVRVKVNEGYKPPKTVNFCDLDKMGILGDRVKLIELDSTGEYMTADRRAAKAHMVNGSISATQENRSFINVASVMQVATDAEVEKAMDELINHYVKVAALRQRTVWSGYIGGLLVSIDGSGLELDRLDGFKIVKQNKFYCIIGKRKVMFLPYGRDLLLGYINRVVNGKSDTGRYITATSLCSIDPIVATSREGLVGKDINYRIQENGVIQVCTTFKGKELLLQKFNTFKVDSEN